MSAVCQEWSWCWGYSDEDRRRLPSRLSAASEEEQESTQIHKMISRSNECFEGIQQGEVRD